MPVPVVLAVATKAQAVASVVQGFASKLGFGDTPLDKRRKQHAADLLAAALGGDVMAVGTLVNEAFSGQRPKVVHDLAKKALRAYVNAAGTLPPQYQPFMSKLGLPTLSPASLQEAVIVASPQPVTSPLTSGSAIVPVVVVGGLLALALIGKRR